MVLAENKTLTCYGGRDDEWNRAVMASCVTLKGGCMPPLWARNPHVQNVLTTVRDQTAPRVFWDVDERITAADGGTVSIQWLGLDAAPAAPVVVVMHTICGSGDALRRFVAHLHRELGWVVAACNRRGHAGLPLTAPQINTMGSTSDLRDQLAAIQARRPGASLYGVGVSAGSGLLVRYLGEEAGASRLRAAVVFCPAYDVPGAFRFIHPRYDAYLSRKLVTFFLHQHADVLSTIDGFDECSHATSLLGFHERLFPLAGFATREAFYAASNPMEVALQAQTPVLVINSADDPVCVKQNVYEHRDALQTLPRMTLAFTTRGSHCGFFDGPLARTSWAYRAIAEYLAAAHRLVGSDQESSLGRV